MPTRLLTLLTAALLIPVSAPVLAGDLLGHVVDKVLSHHDKPHHDNNDPKRHDVMLAEENCDNELGFLPRYEVADIEALSQGAQISITPVCEEMDEVNVAGLLGAIDANEWLRQSLRAHGVTTNDVVGIRIDAAGNAILYVTDETSLASASE